MIRRKVMFQGEAALRGCFLVEARLSAPVPKLERYGRSIRRRNTGIGPNFYSLDMRITKSFYFNRDAGRRLDFVVQGINIFNHTNFSAVNDSFPANPNPFQVGGQTVNLLDGSYDFRGIRSVDASQPLGFKAAFDPRQVQFGLKLIF